MIWDRLRGYGVIVEMDADGSHLPEHLPVLVGALAHADLAIGSRWMPGGRVVNWPRPARCCRGAISTPVSCWA